MIERLIENLGKLSIETIVELNNTLFGDSQIYENNKTNVDMVCRENGISPYDITQSLYNPKDGWFIIVNGKIRSVSHNISCDRPLLKKIAKEMVYRYSPKTSESIENKAFCLINTVDYNEDGKYFVEVQETPFIVIGDLLGWDADVINKMKVGDRVESDSPWGNSAQVVRLK